MTQPLPSQLKEINHFKEQRKKALVKSVLQEHISDEQHVHAHLGRTEYFTVEFTNTSSEGVNYKLIIDDPDY
jgi:hypothetical protein